MTSNKYILPLTLLVVVVLAEGFWLWNSNDSQNGLNAEETGIPTTANEIADWQTSQEPLKRTSEESLNSSNLVSLFSSEPTNESVKAAPPEANADRLGLELVGVGIIGERRTAIIRQAARGRGDASSEKRSYSEREAVGDTGYRIATINPTYVELTNGREDLVLRVRKSKPAEEGDSDAKSNEQTASKSADTQDADTKPPTTAVVAERHKKLLNYRETKPGEDPKSILPTQEEIDYYKAHPEVARERFEKIVAALEAEKQKDVEEEESIAK
jgi:hypothetical protein